MYTVVVFFGWEQYSARAYRFIECSCPYPFQDKRAAVSAAPDHPFTRSFKIPYMFCHFITELLLLNPKRIKCSHRSTGAEIVMDWGGREPQSGNSVSRERTLRRKIIRAPQFIGLPRSKLFLFIYLFIYFLFSRFAHKAGAVQ